MASTYDQIAKAVDRVLDRSVHDALMPMLGLLAGKEPVPASDMASMLVDLQRQLDQVKVRLDAADAQQVVVADAIEEQVRQLNAAK